MSRARLFAPVAEDFRATLVKTINGYIQKNNDKYLKKVGIRRAKKIKNSSLMHAENLSREQLMWRLCSYIKMEKGVGPLGSSSELRMALLNLLVSDQGLGIDNDLILQTQNAMYQGVLNIQMQSAVAGVPFKIDDKKIELKAKVQQIEMHLTDLSSHIPAPSQQFKEKILAVIDAYIDNVNAVWYRRTFKSVGMQRAQQLKGFISEQLVDKEKLDDMQLCARILELASMPIASREAIFGSSKQLRDAVLISMCDFLKVDDQAVNREIRKQLTPVVLQTTMGLIYRVPDVTMVSIEVRLKHLQTALHKCLDDLKDQPHGSVMRALNG